MILFLATGLLSGAGGTPRVAVGGVSIAREAQRRVDEREWESHQQAKRLARQLLDELDRAEEETPQAVEAEAAPEAPRVAPTFVPLPVADMPALAGLVEQMQSYRVDLAPVFDALRLRKAEVLVRQLELVQAALKAVQEEEAFVALMIMSVT